MTNECQLLAPLDWRHSIPAPRGIIHDVYMMTSSSVASFHLAESGSSNAAKKTKFDKFQVFTLAVLCGFLRGWTSVTVADVLNVGSATVSSRLVPSQFSVVVSSINAVSIDRWSTMVPSSSLSDTLSVSAGSKVSSGSIPNLVLPYHH